MKLYFKKLLQTLLFIAALIILTALIFTLSITVLFWLKPQALTIVYLCLVLSAGLLIYAVLLKRYENQHLRSSYLDVQATEDYSFIKDFLATIKSEENVVHTLAFLLIIFANGVRIATTTSRPIAGLSLQIIILLITFTIVNTLIWCFVHRRWIRGCTGVK